MHDVMRRKMWLFLLSALLVLSGCMGGRTLTLDARYDTARNPKPPFSTAGLKVALVPFEGALKMEIGQWRGLTNKIDRLVLPQPAEDVVTAAVADYLGRAGFDVSLSDKGDDPDRFVFVPHGHHAVMPDFVVSGAIDEFAMEADSRVGFTRVNTRIRLKVRTGNVRDGSFIVQSVESISVPKVMVMFNRTIFEDVLNEALSDGLDLILQRFRLEEGALRAIKQQ